MTVFFFSFFSFFFEELEQITAVANIFTHPMSKLLCRSSLLRIAMRFSHHQPLVVRHVHFPAVGVNVCFEHAVNHPLRIQRPKPCQDMTEPDSRLMA